MLDTPELRSTALVYLDKQKHNPEQARLFLARVMHQRHPRWVRDLNWFIGEYRKNII